MIISMEEVPDSREVGFDPPSVKTKWVMEGVFSSDAATNLALSTLPPVALHPYGDLYLQHPSVREMGHKLFEIGASYGQRQGFAQGSYQIEIGSCSVHLQARQGQHIATYPNTFPSHNGLINVRPGTGKGVIVEGFNDDLPAVKFTVHFKHPRGIITESQIRTLSRLKGSVDTEGMFGFDPYEVYFMDFDGLAGSDCETEIAYHLAIRENQTGLSFGSVTGVDVKGWDVPWGNIIVATEGGRTIAKYQYVNVVRIPKERPLKTLLGFG